MKISYTLLYKYILLGKSFKEISFSPLTSTRQVCSCCHFKFLFWQHTFDCAVELRPVISKTNCVLYLKQKIIYIHQLQLRFTWCPKRNYKLSFCQIEISSKSWPYQKSNVVYRSCTDKNSTNLLWILFLLHAWGE